MIPSENYLWWHPQKILLLRDFLSFGNCDGILKTQFPLVFFKWTPPKKKICYPPKMLPCCSFSLKEFYHIYITKTSRKLFDVHSGYSDCRTNLLLIYVDLLRKFGWHPYTIRWYFFPQARYMAYRIPPKNHFTRKTQITHVTHKKRTSRNLPNLFAGSLHSW
jgi:hypothetical protein